jgi:hypothetical protein
MRSPRAPSAPRRCCQGLAGSPAPPPRSTPYLDSEISALVGHGVLPPVLAGARQFVETNRDKLAEIDAENVKFGEVSPFDSHPPLSERIAAVERFAQSGKAPALVGGGDARLGIELLRYPEKLVRELIHQRVGTQLQAIEWDQVAPHFVAEQHYMLARHRGWLEDKSVSDLDRTVETGRHIAQGLEGIGEYAYELERDTLVRIMAQVYTAALSVALEHAGYEPRTGPGEPLRFHHNDDVIDPGVIVRQYLADEMSEAEWAARWENAGIGDRPWAAVAWKQPSSAA